MLRNYLKIAWRNLRKYWTYSLLNVTGLAVGLATAMLILLWVKDEISFDRFHANHTRLYSVRLNLTPSSGETISYESVTMRVAEAMKREIPGVIRTTRFSWGEKALLTYQDKTTNQEGRSADPDFLQMFSFPLVKGNRSTALTEPNTILITQRLADSYFGTVDPLGKLIRVDQATDYKVVGVLANVPANSSLQFDYLTPFKKEDLYTANWTNNNTQVFAQLTDNTTAAQVNDQLKTLTRRHIRAYNDRTYILHAVDDWHLRTHFKNGQYDGGGRIVYVRLFGFVGLLVLLIACINFMNLSTARAGGRAKEVGVRKAVGANRQSLIEQFLSESFLLTVGAGLLAISLVVVALPFFNTALEKHIAVAWLSPVYCAVYIGILLLTGLLAGFYPAFVLSSFQPVKVLKGTGGAVVGSRSSVWLRKSLVVVQFTASIMLLIGTGVVYQQIHFIRNKNLGYRNDHVVYFNTYGIRDNRIEQTRTAFANTPGVRGVTVANTDFWGIGGRDYPDWLGKPANRTILTGVLNADYDLLPTMKIQLKAGRNFSRAFRTDTANVLLNEEAVRQFGFMQPIGHPITIGGAQGPVTGTVIGVVKDFNLASVHSPIEPLIIRCSPKETQLLFARIDSRDIPDVIRAMEQTFKSLKPDFPFDYRFLDQGFDIIYRSEMQIGQLANWFAVLAIFISCLGLFGLASFTVERRTKEIGVRKVLGASLTNIFALVSMEFVGLVVIALMLAAVPIWYFMRDWLAKFAYHVDIELWLFVVAGLLAVGIALLTVSYQAIKAALMNPVRSLRSE